MAEVKEKKTRSKITIQRQIKTNAMKFLMEKANKDFIASGEYSPPTEAEIRTECKKRWDEHLERGKEKEDISMYFD